MTNDTKMTQEQAQTINNFFTVDEWDAIYSAMGDYANYGDDESDVADSVRLKIAKLVALTEHNISIWITQTLRSLVNTPMHNVTASRYTFDEIVQQCFDAINRIPTVSTSSDDSFYNELLQFEEYRILIGLAQ